MLLNRLVLVGRAPPLGSSERCRMKVWERVGATVVMLAIWFIGDMSRLCYRLSLYCYVLRTILMEVLTLLMMMKLTLTSLMGSNFCQYP